MSLVEKVRDWQRIPIKGIDFRILKMTYSILPVFYFLNVFSQESWNANKNVPASACICTYSLQVEGGASVYTFCNA